MTPTTTPPNTSESRTQNSEFPSPSHLATPSLCPSPTPDPALAHLPAYAQEAVTALRGLLHSDHPETVRRAAVNLLAIANISTASPKPSVYSSPPAATLDLTPALNAVQSQRPLDPGQLQQIQTLRLTTLPGHSLIEELGAILSGTQQRIFIAELAKQLPPINPPTPKKERQAPTESPRANPDGSEGAPRSSQVAASASAQPTPTSAPIPQPATPAAPTPTTAGISPPPSAATSRTVAVPTATKDSRLDTGHSSLTTPQVPTYRNQPASASTVATPKPPRPHGPVACAITGRDLAPG